MNRKAAFLVVLLSLAAAASGQPYSEATIHTFNSWPAGAHPVSALVLASDGNLYGTTPDGGSFGYGTVFRVSNPGTSPSLSVIYYFSGGADGGAPHAPLIQASDGNLYGTTAEGGSTGNGTVFKISKLSSSPIESVIYSFVSGNDGANPGGPVIEGLDGSLYGTTVGGGSNGAGTVFRISNPLAAPSESVVHSFGGGADGAYPYAGVVQASDGTLYGTTSSGGSAAGGGVGSVFKITNPSTSPGESLLYTFTGGSDGWSPNPVILGLDGDLYGTTNGGGANLVGQVFRISHPSSYPTFASIHSFAWGADGAYPNAAVMQAADGGLYGTTWTGGSAGHGVVFKIANPSTSPAETVIHTFSGPPDGDSPEASLIQAADGTLFGTTSAGGSRFSGSVFRVVKLSIAPAESVVISFPTSPDGGAYPSPLIQGSDGSLYGTNYDGGPSDSGIVYRISDIGGVPVESLVYSFKGGSDGAFPLSTLLEGTDGNLYGTTSYGGGSGNCAGGCGTVFRISNLASPVESVLYSFTGLADGASPAAPLIQAADGSLYGTTDGGGAHGVGTVFRIADPGSQPTFSGVYEFGAAPGDGEGPASLVQSEDGTLFGMTYTGGANLTGAVFKIANPSTAPSESIIYSFADFPSDGAYPTSLILGTDGNLYGTCFQGGANGYGSVFEVSSPSTSPAERLLYSFAGPPDGNSPVSLIEGADSNLYGATEYGGSNGFYGYGVIFEIDDAASSPKERVLYGFRGVPDGISPTSLLQTVDGNFCGTTFGRDPNYTGVVFKLTRQVTMDPECGPADGGTGLTITGSHFDWTSRASVLGVEAPVVSVAPTQISLASPAGAAGAVGDVVISNQDGTSVTLPDRWGYDFTDVPSGNPFESFVCALARNRITAGCGEGDYCPASSIQRNQMAVFVLRSAHGPTYVPPPATGTMFTDIPATAFAAAFIEEAAREGIMGVGEDTGCGAGLFCPSGAVTRLSMAYILLRGEHGGSYVPPSANCASFPFVDVPCPSPDADFVAELLAAGITAGCDATHYCPTNPVTRAQMAVFLTATFGLQ